MIYAYHVFDIITDLLICYCMSRDLLVTQFGTSKGWFRLVILIGHVGAGMLLFWHNSSLTMFRHGKMPWFAMLGRFCRARTP